MASSGGTGLEAVAAATNCATVLTGAEATGGTRAGGDCCGCLTICGAGICGCWIVKGGAGVLGTEGIAEAEIRIISLCKKECLV